MPSAKRRFRATLEREDVNVVVRIPPEISEAFAEWTKAGRIVVEGRVRGVAFLQTLVPIRGRRHKLFFHAGTRAFASIQAGDGVVIELRAISPEEVGPTEDLGQALGNRRAAFDALPASLRRQLVRMIENALTPETRARRVEEAAAQVLRREVRKQTLRPMRPLWTCPRCRNRFVTRNMYHSCRRGSIDEPFEGRPQFVRDLFTGLRTMVERNGPVTLVPYRDRVAFMVDVRFAGARPRKDHLAVDFWLPHRIEDPRFQRVETLTGNAHVYTVRVSKPSDLNRQLAGWLREAYAVGRREHLKPSGAR